MTFKNSRYSPLEATYEGPQNYFEKLFCEYSLRFLTNSHVDANIYLVKLVLQILTRTFSLEKAIQ